MRQHLAELVGTQRRHQRQADDQVAARPAEHAQARHLRHRGVVVVGDQYAVRPRRAHGIADALDLGKQARRLPGAQLAALRWSYAHPQRAQHRPGEPDRQPYQLEQFEQQDRLEQADRDQAQAEQHRPEHQHQQVEIAQRRQSQHFETVAQRMGLGAARQPLHQDFKTCLVHARCLRWVDRKRQ